MRIQILISGFKALNVLPTTRPTTQITLNLLYAGFTALISRATADLTWRSYVGANHTELPRLVPKFPLFRLTLIRVLWVKPTRSWKVISSFCPCQTFSYGHVEIWCIFQLDMYHHSHHFNSFKKDKDVKHERYSGEIMFTKNECIWISSPWAL